MARQTEFIELSEQEQSSLKTFFRSGKSSNRQQTRARILDLLSKQTPPPEIARLLGCALPTVYNVKRRFLAEGLQAALQERTRSGKPPSISGEARARITALACSQAPAGHARWTLRLLADKSVELGFVEQISHQTVKQILKKTRFDRT
jgi:putative transposase